MPDHLPLGDGEGGKEGRGAVAKVIVGHALDVAKPQGEQGLAALERLDLIPLIDTQHQRLIRWVQAQPHDVAHLLHKERIARELKAPHAVRGHAKERKVACRGAPRDAGGLRSCSVKTISRFFGRPVLMGYLHRKG